MTSRKADGRHCVHCGAVVVFVQVFDRWVPVEPGEALRGRMAGGPASPKHKLVSVLLETGWCPRIWPDPNGNVVGRILHTPRCPEWKPPEPEPEPAPRPRSKPKKGRRGFRV